MSLRPLRTIEEAAEAAAGAAKGFAESSRLPAHARAKALLHVSEGLAGRKEELARLVTEEVGKPLKEARRELDRAIFTFRWASEEAQRFGGEWLPLDLDANGEGRLAIVRRFPRGPCLFITPFNFPVNLVAHKVAPAMAVGASFVLKPAPQAPKVAGVLAELLRESGYPEAASTVCPCPNEVAEALVKDGRFAVLSFTGSAAVGWKLRALAAKKQVLLELGGNGCVVIGPDADLPWAAARCAWGAFYYSGQVCISVQRIIAHETVFARFKDLFLKNVAELKVGEPSDEHTDVGPLIDDRAAERVESWVAEAAAGGGRVILGGKRTGRLLPPTLVEEPPQTCKLAREEAFGPVATLEKVATLELAFDRVAASAYGLQAGLFTRDIGVILRAWERLPVGGLIVNDIPSYRSEAMPYGGNRDSGIGREGVRYAMEEFTEPRTLVLRS
ncbi:MAG: aldehyde dehydrogenase family protein [Elusimicrobia bacterium]|nr:aldehyde dehydrogenase family protein [Elusimicrobiota bacterium]